MNLNDSFIFSINKLNRSLIRRLDTHLRKYALTTKQLFTLIAVSENPNCSLTELCHVLEADRTTVSRGAEILRKDELIEVNKSKEDTRSYHVNLLKKGTNVIKETKKLLATIDDELREQSKATLVLLGEKK